MIVADICSELSITIVTVDLEFTEIAYCVF